MKLTKGKISKLYNKHKQSCRRKKIYKRRKNNQSFRKMKPLNLATKTLKMKGGISNLGTKINKAKTDAAELASSKYNDLKANLKKKMPNIPSVLSTAPTEAFNILLDFKSTGKDWYIRSKRGVYQTEESIRNKINDLNKGVKNLIFTDIQFSEFTNATMYKQVMLSMYEFETIYAARYVDKKEANEDGKKKLFDVSFNNVSFFKELYICLDYQKYCEQMDEYVNDAKSKEMHDFFKRELVDFAPDLNQGFLTICNNNIRQLEFAMKKKEDLTIEVVKFQKSGGDTKKLVEDDIKKLDKNPVFFKSILEFFVPTTADPVALAPGSYRAYYDLIYDNKKKYNTFVLVLNNKLKRSLNDTVFQILLSALNKMGKLNQSYLEQAKQSILSLTSEGIKFYARQTTFQNNIRSFEETTTDKLLIDKNNTAVKSLQDKLVMNKLATEKNGGDGETKLVQAETNSDTKDVKAEKTGGAAAADLIIPTNIITCLNNMVTTSKSDNGNEFDPPTITGKFLLDIEQCITFEDYTYVLMEYSKKLDNRILVLWIKYLDSYKPDLNTAYYNEYKKVLDDLKYKLYVKQNPGFMSRFLTQINGENDEELKFVESQLDNDRKVKEWNSNKDQKAVKKSDNAIKELKKVMIGEDKIFDDLLGLHDTVDKVMTTDGEQDGGGAEPNTKYKVLNDIYTNYTKKIDYYASTLNKNQIRDARKALSKLKDVLNTGYYDELMNDLNKIEEKNTNPGMIEDVRGEKLLRKTSFFDEIYNAKHDDTKTKLVVEEYSVRLKCEDFKNYDSLIKTEFDARKIDYNDYKMLKTAIDALKTKINCQNVLASIGLSSTTSKPSNYEEKLDERIKILEDFIKNPDNSENENDSVAAFSGVLSKIQEPTVSNTTTVSPQISPDQRSIINISVGTQIQDNINEIGNRLKQLEDDKKQTQLLLDNKPNATSSEIESLKTQLVEKEALIKTSKDDMAKAVAQATKDFEQKVAEASKKFDEAQTAALVAKKDADAKIKEQESKVLEIQTKAEKTTTEHIKKIAELEATVDQANQQATTAASEKGALETEIKAKIEEIVSLKGNTESAAAKQELETIKTELEVATNKANAQQELLVTQQSYLDKQKTDLAQSLQNRNAEIKEATAAVTTEKDAAIAKAAYADRLKEEAALAFETAKSQKEAEINRLKLDHSLEMKSKDDALEAKNSELVAAQNEIKSTNEALTQNVVQQQELTSKQTELQNQLNQEKTRFMTQQATIKSSSDLSAVEQAARMEEANKSVEELKAKLHENVEQLALITKVNNDLTKKQTELDTEMETLKNAKGSLEKELENSKRANDSLKPHLVTQLEGNPDYGVIINGILTSIRGGGDGDITLASHATASDFLAGIGNLEINIALDSCKSPSSDKDVRLLKGQMKLFKDLINKVIYGTPVLLMLNSLSFEEYDKLKLTINQGDDQTNTSIKDLVDYMGNFTNFIFIDTTQIYEFSGDYKGPYMITNSEKSSEFQSVTAKLDNTYNSVNAICKNIADGLPKQSIDVMKIRKTKLATVLATPSDEPVEGTFNYKDILKVTHILELISYLDELINKDDGLFANQFTNNDLYAFINSFMYGRITKLNALITSVTAIESCNVGCQNEKCDAKPCKMSLNSFKKTLSELTYERKPVSTYLILNNRGEGNIYNQNRFGLATDDATRYLQLKYNDDDEGVPEDKAQLPPQNGGKYGKTYLFGEFDKIYGLTLPQAGTKQLRNEFIASDLLKIQSQLLEGKLVFLFGYGQSGAGKTSTLIYFKDPLNGDAEKGEQGVLVHLCNLFGKGTYKATLDVQPVAKYTKLKLITQEFYSSDNVAVGNCDGVANNIDKCKEQTFDFTFDGKENQFMLPSKGLVSTSIKKQEKFKYRHKLRDQSLFGDRSFGGVLQYLIDKDRFVKPTTNNPDSSRSHSLIYIVLSDDSGKKLRIGLADLAGVESKFKCDEQDVIKAFLKLNKERETKDNSSYVPNKGETRTYGKSIDPEFSLSRNDVDELLAKEIVYTNGAFGSVGDEAVITAMNKFNDELTQFFKDDNGLVPTFDLVSTANPNNINNYETQINAYRAISSALSGVKGGNRKTRKFMRKTKGKTRKIVQSGGDTELQILQTALAGINPNAKTALDNFKSAIKDLAKKASGFGNTIVKWIMDKVDKDDIFQSFSAAAVEFAVGQEVVASWLQYKQVVQRIQETKTIDNLIKLLGSKLTKNQKIMIARKIQKMIKSMPNKYENAKTIMKYGKDICNERTSEGIFINKTLTELRETIFEIMIKKTKQWIYYSPSFHYECLSDLCPTDRNCFSIKSTAKEPTEPKSLIIKWLFEKDKSNNNPQTYDDFCSNIQIGLFGVFNIWKGANNPPPVSYIDINELKKKWNKMNDTNYGGSNDALKTDTTSIINIIEAVSKYILERKVDTSIKELTEKVSNFQLKTFDYNGITLTGPYRTLIDEFIKSIEINNSTTAIGTLEYLDSFAKLNTTDTVCSKPADKTFTNITKSIQ